MISFSLELATSLTISPCNKRQSCASVAHLFSSLVRLAVSERGNSCSLMGSLLRFYAYKHKQVESPCKRELSKDYKLTECRYYILNPMNAYNKI